MDVPGGVFELLFGRLLRIGIKEGEVLVHRLRDDIEVKLLGGARLLELVERQAFFRRIGEPLLDRNAVALCLGNLLALLVEKQLVDVVQRRRHAEDFADPVVDAHVGLVVLAEHLEVDTEGCPAHAEVGLPLQLHIATRHRQRRVFAVLVDERHCSRFRVDRLHRHVQHATRGGRDWQERRVRLPPLIAQCRQHHFHDGVVLLRRPHQHRVEPAGLVERRCRSELILEAKRIQERPQARIHVRAIALMRAERVGHGGQRLLQERMKFLGVRHRVRHLAHAVHVVRHADQARGVGAAGQRLERAADHGRAHDFAERADVRQARGAIAGLEDHRCILRPARLFQLLDARFQLAGLFEGPGFCGLREGGDGHGELLFAPPKRRGEQGQAPPIRRGPARGCRGRPCRRCRAR